MCCFDMYISSLLLGEDWLVPNDILSYMDENTVNWTKLQLIVEVSMYESLVQGNE